MLASGSAEHRLSARLPPARTVAWPLPPVTAQHDHRCEPLWQSLLALCATGNILFSPARGAVVIDFGLSSGSTRALAAATQTAGTPGTSRPNSWTIPELAEARRGTSGLLVWRCCTCAGYEHRSANLGRRGG